MYFFDLDGTLLDSNGIWLDIDIEFLGRRGISPVPEDYTDYFTHHSAPDAGPVHQGALLPPGDAGGDHGGLDVHARSAYAHTLPLKPGVPPFWTPAAAGGHGWRCSPPACLPCAAPPWSTTAFWTALRPFTPPLSWE